MVRFTANDGTFPRPPLFQAKEAPAVRFPIQRVEIDWGRLQAKRALVLDTVDQMPGYLLYPEVLGLLSQAYNLAMRLILDLMWSTGARVSEVLALKPTSFIDDGYDFGVVLTTVKQKARRPSKAVLARSAKRYVPIQDRVLKDRIQSFLWAGGAPFNISAHTFRHSFAVHLLLHARPFKVVSQLLGHRSVGSTEIYTNVLTVDVAHFFGWCVFSLRGRYRPKADM